MLGGRTRRRLLAATAALLATTVALGLGQSAAAATTIGNGCGLTLTVPNVNVVSTANAAGEPFPAAVPSAGVITSWALAGPPEVELLPMPKFFDALKVFRATGIPGQLQVVAESAAEPIHSGSNVFQARIPVRAGDLLGNSGLEEAGGESEQVAAVCETSDPGDKLAGIEGDPSVGETVSTLEREAPAASQPITAAVEPDVDGDGYGDETQDQCPTDASTQGPCPTAPPPSAPAPPPLTLSAAATVTKGHVVVTVRAGAQASVTVAGTAKLGQGKSAGLSGGTQVVVPGAAARFVVLFPAKVKARLKQLTPRRKLMLRLSATAPAATATSLTVKVKGQKKPAGTRRRGA